MKNRVRKLAVDLGYMVYPARVDADWLSLKRANIYELGDGEYLLLSNGDWKTATGNNYTLAHTDKGWCVMKKDEKALVFVVPLMQDEAAFLEKLNTLLE